MIMRQREILNAISPDFKRDNVTQDEYITNKIEEIKQATIDYINSCGMDGFILGLSGGIDSFVCGALVADAMQKIGKKLYIIMLPNKIQSDINDSIECAKCLTSQFDSVVEDTISIENSFAGVKEDLKDCVLKDNADRYAMGNLQARLRMVIQYTLAKKLLVAGTDHATESITGYFTKFGDGGCDFTPTDGLVKDDIYRIAKRYNAPECVMKKAPAAGLGISNCDEDELKVSYKDLCNYLYGNIIEKDKAERIMRLYDVSEHKRHLAASPKNLWWKNKPVLKTHIVIDALNDFISGSLPCLNAKNAVKESIAYINENPNMQVLYVRDHHPSTHCSFKENGGIWPAHCVENTFGAEISKEYYTDVEKTINSPVQRFNIFNKGENKELEEYSGFNAKNAFYGELKANLTKQVIVSGMATEYCVKETVLLLLENGYEVSILKRGLAYIDKEEHEKVLKELEEMGAKII